MAAKQVIAIILAALSAAACTGEKPAVKAPKTEAPVIMKAKPKVMTGEQKAELAFPPEIISQVEAAAGAPAEPFFEDVMMRSSNLKGDVMITAARLSGFSVHTRNAGEVIAALSRQLRSQGFLIFRSEQNYGSVPDVVTVVRGESSYDILRIQKTEAPHYHLDTARIIKWLRTQQKTGSFVVTGAGADWVEATFIHQPRNMKDFAQDVAAFAPDALRDGASTVDKLADRMAKENGFRLAWE